MTFTLNILLNFKCNRFYTLNHANLKFALQISHIMVNTKNNAPKFILKSHPAAPPNSPPVINLFLILSQEIHLQSGRPSFSVPKPIGKLEIRSVPADWLLSFCYLFYQGGFLNGNFHRAPKSQWQPSSPQQTAGINKTLIGEDDDVRTLERF